MTRNGNAAWGSLLITYLRSKKVIMLLLVIVPFLFTFATAMSNMEVLKTPAELSNYIAQNQGNPLFGHIAGDTMEAATVWRIRLSTAILMAIFSIILVTDTTRKDEDLGKLELLRAGAVGLNAPLTATIIKVYGANLLGGITMMLGFVAAGFTLSGSFVAGMATGLCGCCVAAIATLFAQIAPNARLSRGLSFGTIAFLLFLQIIINASGNESLLALTPFSWSAYARPYAGENWLIFLIAVPVISLITVISYCLLQRRDMGSGYLPERKGRSAARAGLKNPFALAWGQQRGALFVWAAAYALMGLVVGSLIPTIDSIFEGTTFLPELSAAVGGPGKAFIAILSYILAQITVAFVLITVFRMREEESLTRTELVLSTAVSRSSYMMSHICIAYIGSAAIIALYGICSGDFISCVSRIPAIWIIASVAVLLYGTLPRVAAPVGWSMFAALLVLEFIWELRIIGYDLFKLSPFAWVYPGVAVSIIMPIIMIAISAVLTGLGLLGFRYRNIIAG